MSRSKDSAKLLFKPTIFQVLQKNKCHGATFLNRTSFGFEMATES